MEQVTGTAPEATAPLLDQLGSTQRRLLDTLLHHPQGLPVGQLGSHLGITANAVRQHLAALERDGLVHFKVTAAGRGRPGHFYELTDRGREAFPRRYHEMAAAVLAELAGRLEEPELKRTMRRMGERAAGSIQDRKASVAAVADTMTQLGYAARATSGSEIVANNCVFHHLAAQFPAVCQFDLGFMEAATGRKVEHRECMVRGGKCCRFHFKR